MSKKKELVELFESQIRLRVLAGDIPEPLREVSIFPERKWRVDYYWAKARLAIELEGGVAMHMTPDRDGNIRRSRHMMPKGWREDSHKYATLAVMRCHLMRFDIDMVRDGYAIQYVQDFLAHLPKPSLAKVPKSDPPRYLLRSLLDAMQGHGQEKEAAAKG